MRYYGLAQRPWIEEDGFGYWGLPEGTIGSVDLAALGSQSYVFVTSDAPFDPAVVAASFGDGTKLDTYEPTQAEKDQWETLIGVPFNGTTLLDGLWNILTVDADPDGTTRAKPLMPTHKGVLNLHLGGHSLIRSEQLPVDPTQHPAWSNIQRVLQNSYRKIRKEDPTLARKWMGAQQIKYKFSPERARDLLIPADLPKELPIPPTTTIGDDFTDTSGTDLELHTATGANGGFSWTVYNWLGGSTAEMEINGSGRVVSVGGDPAGRAETDLSSDDHYTQAAVYAQHFRAAVLARHSDSATTFYYVDAGGSEWRTWRSVSGTLTNIGTNVTDVAVVDGDILKIEVDGSNISRYRNGVLQDGPITDTNITGNTRTGLISTGSQIDNFEAADLVAGNDPLVADQGSYTLSGQSVGLKVNRKLTADQGSYSLTGQDSGLLKGNVLTAEQRSFTLSGQSVGLRVNRKLTIEQGSFTLTGQSVALRKGYYIAAAQGSYAFTGQDVPLIKSYRIVMDSGGYTLSGQSTGLLRNRTLSISQGSYALTGQDVGFTYSGDASPLLTDLVSYWKLDEASGTRADSHASNDLTDNNTVGSGTGILNNGASFVRANSETLSITDAAQSGLDITSDFALSFWMKCDPAPSDEFYFLVGKWSSTGADTAYALLYRDNGGTKEFWLRVSDGSPENLIIGTSAVGTSLVHVVAQWDASASTGEIFVNTASQGTDTGAKTSLTSGSAPFIIGGDLLNDVNYMDGIIDEVGIWSRLLTTSEISELYNSGAANAYPFGDAGNDPLEAEQGSYTLTGQDVGLTVNRKITTDQGSYTLTGQDTGLEANRLLEAEQGSYTLTGQDVDLSRSRYVEAAQGSYTLSGQAVGLTVNRKLTAAQGSYALTGQTVEFTKGYHLTAENGSYTVTGQAADLKASRTLTAAQGSYTLTGQDVTLSTDISLTAEQGSYTLSGQAVQLTINRTISLDQGNYTLTGQDVGLARRRSLTASQGSYTLTGQDTTFVLSRLLSAGQGTYTLDGQDVSIVPSGWTTITKTRRHTWDAPASQNVPTGTTWTNITKTK